MKYFKYIAAAALGFVAIAVALPVASNEPGVPNTIIARKAHIAGGHTSKGIAVRDITDATNDAPDMETDGRSGYN